MDKPDAERRLLAALKNVKTWEEMYEWFDAQVRVSVNLGHPAIVYGSLFFMHSFLQAMRELPDEGDIQKLIARMVRVLIYEEREKFSVEVSMFLGPEPTKEQEDTAQEAYEALMASLLKPKE